MWRVEMGREREGIGVDGVAGSCIRSNHVLIDFR